MQSAMLAFEVVPLCPDLTRVIVLTGSLSKCCSACPHVLLPLPYIPLPPPLTPAPIYCMQSCQS